MQHHSSGAQDVPLIPKKDPKDIYKGINIRLRQWLWDELKRIAEDEDETRNGVVEFFLTSAVTDYKALKAKQKK